MADFGLNMTVGDRRRIKISATWPVDVPEQGATKGQAYDLGTAQKVWFTAKASQADSDANAIIKKDTSLSGVNDITITGGVAYLDIVEADTATYATITRKVTLYCDVQVKSSGGEVWTVAKGTLDLLPQITQSS